MSTLGRFARNSFYSAAAEGSIGLFFLVFLISARCLGKVEFGVFSLAWALVGVMEIINDLGLRFVFTKDVARRRDKGASYLSTMMSMQLVLSLFSFAVVWAAASVLLPTPRHRALALILQGASVLRSAKFLARYVFRTYDRFDLEAFLLVAERMAILVIASLVFWRGFRSAEALAWTLLGVRVVDAGVTYLLLGRTTVRPRFGWNPLLGRTLLVAALPFALGHFVSMALYRVGTLVLGFLRPHSPGEVGYVQAAYQWIQGVGMFAIIFRNILFPMISESHDEHREEAVELYRRGLRYVIVLSLPLAGLGLILASDLMQLLGAEYAPGTIVLQILLLTLPLNFVSRVGTVAMAAMHRQGTVVAQTATAAAVALFGSWWGVTALGYPGVAVAALAAETVFAVLVVSHLSGSGYRVPWVALAVRPALATAATAPFLWWARSAPIWARLPVGGVLYLGFLTVFRFWDAEEYALATGWVRGAVDRVRRGGNTSGF